MSLKIGLQLKGSLFRDLTGSQKEELLSQLKNLQRDPNYTEYRYYRTQYNKWIIVNAFALPMKTSKNIWRDQS
jgi:hypothetical protein